MYYILATSGFQNLWYWALYLIVWVIIAHRTVGVPYGMLVRARAQPNVADKVEKIAHITAQRVTGLVDRYGIWVWCLIGFVLALLGTLGFWSGVEVAQAAFMLAFPICIVIYSTIATARAIVERNFRGPVLVRILVRRRFWHQVVAILSALAALSVALSNHPSLLGV